MEGRSIGLALKGQTRDAGIEGLHLVKTAAGKDMPLNTSVCIRIKPVHVSTQMNVIIGSYCMFTN